MRIDRRLILGLGIAVIMSVAAIGSYADETCNSPYMSGLIKGQEDFVHVWTLGVPGLGDGSDKLVTIDANPASKTYGKVIHKISVGGRGEAHHMGFTDDRKYLWAGGLDDSKIYVFDVGTNPSHPKLVKTIDDLPAKTGYAGPHTYYALPGRMLIGNLSNVADKGGVTGMAVYNNKGGFVAKYDMPASTIKQIKGDGYGYDIAVNPAKNALLTSSFTGWNNFMRDLGEVVKDPEAMKHFGGTMVMWNLKTMEPEQILAVPGAPLEIRWALPEGQNWAITAAALTSARRSRPLAGEGRRRDRRSGEDSFAGGYFDHGRCEGFVGEHLHGRHHALFRSHRPRASAANLRQAHRRTGEHGVAELGRAPRLHDLELAVKVG